MTHWKRPDLLKEICSPAHFDELASIRTERSKWPHSRHWSKKLQSISDLPELRELKGENPVATRFDEDVVEIGRPEDLRGTDDSWAFEDVVTGLMPWRKGPFRLFDLEIDTEWRSNLKWDRIAAALGDLSGKSLIDVGCGNGYYLYRALGLNVARAIGLDPSVPFYLQFELFQKYAQRPELQFEMLGAEHLNYFRDGFDVALCMGILYHQRNPVSILKALMQSLRPGGTAIIESQIIPGEDSIALFPEDRYAKARNVFFVPTTQCLVNWAKRAGFTQVDVLSVDVTEFDEQRKTRWTTFESLEDFLDPNDSSLTVEGLPAPRRAAIRAERPT